MILFSLFQIICKNSTLYTDIVLKNHAELELYSDEKGFMISEKVSLLLYNIFNQLFNKLIVFFQFCIAMNNIEHVCQCVMTVPHEFSFYEDRAVITVVEFQSLYFIVVFIN